MYLKRFWDNQSGQAAIMFSLASVPFFVSAGIAVDYVNWRNHETRLQSIADSAALAGAMAYAFEGNSKKDANQAQNRATTAVNGYIDAHHANLNQAPVLVFETDPQAIEVNLSETGLRTLTALMPGADANIRVTAKAVISAVTTSPCIIGLDETATPAVRFSGSGQMTAENCAVWSNSTQSVALEGSGSGSATASMFCAAGGVLGGSTTFSSPPQSNCPPVEDPLVNLDMPTIGLCKETNLHISGSGTIPIEPGVYCGGIKLTSQATLQLAPGEYIMTDGALDMVGGSSLEGTGVTIFLTGAGSGLKLGGASSINISAPTSGTYAGVAFYSDRTSATQTSALSGSNSLDIEGTIYLPNHDLSYSGSNSATLPANFTVLIANTVEFTGSSEVSIRSNFDASDVPVPTTVLQGRIMPRLIR